MMRHETQHYEVPASLDGPGIRFHGHREHEVPPHVWQAIRDAAQRVLDNYTRVGTPCGHAPAHEGLNHCGVMICPHVLPPGEYEVTRARLDSLALSPNQQHLMRLHPALNIRCPRCNAPRGLMCIAGGRPFTRVHVIRKKTWNSTPAPQRNELIDQED